MTRLLFTTAILALLSACSSMSGGSMSGDTGAGRTTMGGPGTGTPGSMNGRFDPYGSGGGGPN